MGIRISTIAVMLGACTTSAPGPDVTASSSFVFTDRSDTFPSQVSDLYQKRVDIEIVLDPILAQMGDPADPPTCKTTLIYKDVAKRTARGATADLVKTQILDMLDWWDVRLNFCEPASSSSVTLHSDVNLRKFAIACSGLPPPAFARDAAGFPLLTTFVATECHVTLLDELATRFESFGGTMNIVTGRDHVPY